MTDSTSSPTSFHLNDPNARGFDAEKSGVLSDRGLILDNGETDKQINDKIKTIIKYLHKI